MKFLLQLLELPFKFLFKIVITILNLIPTRIYEIHGLKGNTKNQRPDLRELFIQVKGKRKLHLGHALIAYLNGQIIKAELNTEGQSQRGVWTEDYEQIISKWGI